MTVRGLAVAFMVSCVGAASSHAACTDVGAAKVAVTAVSLPDCPAGAGGRAVRRARQHVRALLAHADARCARGHDAGAAALVEKAAGILAAADARLERAIAAQKLDADCATAYRTTVDALTAAVDGASDDDDDDRDHHDHGDARAPHRRRALRAPALPRRARPRRRVGGMVAVRRGARVRHGARRGRDRDPDVGRRR